jgi:hypothetical protein
MQIAGVGMHHRAQHITSYELSAIKSLKAVKFLL